MDKMAFFIPQAKAMWQFMFNAELILGRYSSIYNSEILNFS